MDFEEAARAAARAEDEPAPSSEQADGTSALDKIQAAMQAHVEHWCANLGISGTPTIRIGYEERVRSDYEVGEYVRYTNLVWQADGRIFTGIHNGRIFTGIHMRGEDEDPKDGSLILIRVRLHVQDHSTRWGSATTQIDLGRTLKHETTRQAQESSPAIWPSLTPPEGTTDLLELVGYDELGNWLDAVFVKRPDITRVSSYVIGDLEWRRLISILFSIGPLYYFTAIYKPGILEVFHRNDDKKQDLTHPAKLKTFFGRYRNPPQGLKFR